MNKEIPIDERVAVGIALQRIYCDAHNYPMFAPPSGKCSRCNVYWAAEQPVDYRLTNHVTGCSHCGTSWCD